MTTIPLKRVARVIAGQSPKSDEVEPLAQGLPFIQGNGEFGPVAPTPRYQCDVAPKRARSGDILISVRAPVGALNTAASHLGIGRGVAAIRPFEPDSRFTRYALFSQVSALRARAVGSTFESVTAEDLENLSIPLVGLETQRRIADFLDDQVSQIEAIATARAESLRLVNEARASASRVAVLGLADDRPTVPIGLPWAPEAGQGWSRRRLSHLARMGTGHTPSRSNEEYWVDCDIPWLTTSDVHRFRRDEITSISETAVNISELGIANSAAVLHPEGTVALSRTASAGFSIIMDVPMATSQDFVTWRCGPTLVPRFLLGTLRLMRPYLLGYLAMGSTHKTIYFPDLQDLSIPVPDVSQQQQIARELDSIDARALERAATVTKQITLLNEYKQSLITAAVTGQIDVTTASGRSIPA